MDKKQQSPFKKENIGVTDGKFKKPLSLNIKNLLSPNAKVKSDRRSNYMFRHSSDKIDTNLLILLHGAGDSHLPYHELTKKMDLPQTATLSINANAMNRGFVTLPFDLGYTWFEEMDYNNGEKLKNNDLRRLSSLENASDKIDRLIDEIISSDQWIAERIFLLGFSAGACVAMNLCYNRSQRGKRALGGAVCIKGGLYGHMNNSKDCNKRMEHTPILLMGGECDENYTVGMLNKDAALYKNGACRSSDLVRSFIQPGKGHYMVNQKEEIRCIMEFFADKMIRRMIAMEGFSEVSGFVG